MEDDPKLILSTRNFTWLVQTIHQAYHGTGPQTFRECPRTVCRSAVGMMAMGAEEARGYEIYLRIRRQRDGKRQNDGGPNAQ